MSKKSEGNMKGEQKVKVLVQFIQDRSGSMVTTWSEVLSGYKVFVDGMKKGDDADKVEYLFTLTTFDTLIETPIKERPITEVTGSELVNYPPRGSTALYDAVGKTLESTNFQADKYICVIVTDGQENSSREWSKDALHAAIDAKIKLGNWTFTYLGTQPETWDDATSIGVGVGATVTYDPTKSHDTYAYMSNTLKNFASSSVMASACLMTDARFNKVEDQQKIGMRTRGAAASNCQATPPTKAESPKKSSKSWR
jgi:hypothetical protein